MRYDVHPPLGHPEVAGWVLGALDRTEAEAFGEHLWSCAQCQASASEFEAVAKALDRPVPADEPPSGLEARVLAAVQQAAVQQAAVQQAAMTPAGPEEPEESGYAEEPAEAAGLPQAGSTWHAVEGWRMVDATQAGQPPRLEQVPRLGEATPLGKGPRLEQVPRLGEATPLGKGPRLGRGPRLGEGGSRPAARPTKIQRRQRRRSNGLLMAAAAATAAGVTFLGLEVFPGAAPAVAATIPLSAQGGATGSGTATVRQAQGGWSIQLTEHNLKKLPAGQFYECWYAGPADRPGHRQLISAGTFIVDRSGGETFAMWSAADPHRYRIMEITAESPGDLGQQGKVILKGTVLGG